MQWTIVNVLSLHRGVKKGCCSHRQHCPMENHFAGRPSLPPCARISRAKLGVSSGRSATLRPPLSCTSVLIDVAHLLYHADLCFKSLFHNLPTPACSVHHLLSSMSSRPNCCRGMEKLAEHDQACCSRSKSLASTQALSCNAHPQSNTHVT